MTRYCKETDCHIIANFNLSDKKHGMYCSTHKKDKMININKNTCKVHDCNIRPHYNLPDQKRGLYCATHKSDGMINVKNKTCKEPECKSFSRIFNLPDQKGGLYCATHKKDNMINVVNPMCQESECTIRSIFNLPGQKRGLYCATHKKDKMINVKDKTCQEPDCNIQPYYNLPDQKRGLYCATHKKNKMINVKDKTCQEPDCNIQPSYNLPDQKRGLYCAKHKKTDMINVVNPKCEEPECSIEPSYNLPDQKRGAYCVSHKKSGMVDVKHKTCVECNRIRSNAKYRYHCLRCFIFKFPEEKISRNYKIKEQHMVDYIREVYPDMAFVFDKTVGGCSKRRPDAYLDLLTHILIIECDENQHTGYNNNCENKRTMELYTDFSHRPIVFIRFNPDTYTMNNKKVLSSFKTHKTSGAPMIRNKKEWTERLTTLKTTIDKHLKTISEKAITIENLYFDA
jgi:hypothetical protein